MGFHYKLVAAIAERNQQFDGPARFLRLVWMMWCASGGVDMNDGEWRGSDDDDAEAPATAAPPEAPKRPVEVASESLPMAQRKPKRKKSSNSSAAGAAGD